MSKQPGRFIDRLDSATRKKFPMATGLIDYAPDALAAISHVSWVGNEKHNKGEPLHHARGKSMDHADCQVRHLSTRRDADPAYAGDPIEAVSHLAQKAWRAIIELQEAMEEIYDLDLAPGARPAPLAPPPPEAHVGFPVDMTKFDGLTDGDEFSFDFGAYRRVEGNVVYDENGDITGMADDMIYKTEFKRYIVKAPR